MKSLPFFSARERPMSLRGEGADLLTIVILHISRADRVRSRCSTKVRRISNAFGKQSLSDNQQWIFTLTTMGLPFARTLRPSAARPKLPTLFFFFFFRRNSTPKRSINHPVMAAPRFLSAHVYMPAHTRSRRSIYIYIEFIPYREFILRIPSRSFLPERRVVRIEGRLYITSFSPTFRLCTEVLHKFRKHNKI